METVVYDSQSHRAHSLNKTVSFVWKQCDGRTTEDDIAKRLPDALGLPADPDIVQVALRELSKAHLLLNEPTPIGKALPSRRELTRRLALVGASAAALIPVVTSIVAPTPAMAHSGPEGHDNGKAWGPGGKGHHNYKGKGKTKYSKSKGHHD